jgi:hypothetical protein
MPSLTELAEHALALAKRLDSYTDNHNLPPVSLDQDTLSFDKLPQELRDVRHELGDTAQLIKQLANDPVRNLMETMFSVSFGPFSF